MYDRSRQPTARRHRPTRSLARNLLGVAGVITLVVAAPGRAEPTVQQLQGMYEDALRQLQQSQDRKNQLAGENELLKSRIAALESQLQVAAAALDDDYNLRAERAAWRAFLAGDAPLQARFDLFVIGPRIGPMMDASAPAIDTAWPFLVINRAPTSAPATMFSPTTSPATTEPANSGTADAPAAPTTAPTLPSPGPATAPASQAIDATQPAAPATQGAP